MVWHLVKHRDIYLYLYHINDFSFIFSSLIHKFLATTVGLFFSFYIFQTSHK